VGARSDRDGGLTDIGRIVLDAWVFGILPETDDCAGWDASRIDQLYARVSEAWEPYGRLPSRLPPALRQRHTHLYAQAVQQAREQGWNPELGDDDN
jgi:hypothetical protein